MSQSTDPDVFRQKLEEARAAARAAAVPMVFAGFPCKVRVLPKIHFVNAGRMPEHLTRRLLAVTDKADAAQPAIEPTAAEIVEGEVFMRKAVCAVIVEPAVVEAAPVPPGGYLYADLLESAPAFISAVFQWIMRDCPMPKEEKGEEVLGVEDLEKFPDGEGRSTRAKSGHKGKGQRERARGAAAPDRERISAE